jgi:hypothetical protein
LPRSEYRRGCIQPGSQNAEAASWDGGKEVMFGMIKHAVGKQVDPPPDVQKASWSAG